MTPFGGIANNHARVARSSDPREIVIGVSRVFYLGRTLRLDSFSLHTVQKIVRVAMTEIGGLLRNILPCLPCSSAQTPQHRQGQQQQR